MVTLLRLLGWGALSVGLLILQIDAVSDAKTVSPLPYLFGGALAVVGSYMLGDD